MTRSSRLEFVIALPRRTNALKSACHGSAIAALIVPGPTDGANRNGAAYDDSRTGQRHH
jgi:hypothetical protein